MYLCGTNTYRNTTINPGATLIVGDGASSTGTLGNGTVVNSGTLTFWRGSANMVSNKISGTGTLLVNGMAEASSGGNFTTLSHSNTYTGQTRVDANAGTRHQCGQQPRHGTGTPTPGQLILGGEGGPGYAAGGVLQTTGSVSRSTPIAAFKSGPADPMSLT